MGAGVHRASVHQHRLACVHAAAAHSASFYSLFASFEEEEKKPDPPWGERTPLFTTNFYDALPDGVAREIGDCVHSLTADVDGDGRRERVCVRVAVYKTQEGQALYDSLIVDIFKNGDWLLRQELDRGLFREERFHLLRDLDMDGRAELVTLLSSGSERSGGDACRIYKFDGYAFVEAMHVFGLPPQDASVAFFLRHLPEVQADISARYIEETGSDDLCGDPGEEGDCFAGSPWLLDSNADGRLELVQLLEPPGGGDASEIRPVPPVRKGIPAPRHGRPQPLPLHWARVPAAPKPERSSFTGRTKAACCCWRPSPTPAPLQPPAPWPLSNSPEPG